MNEVVVIDTKELQRAVAILGAPQELVEPAMKKAVSRVTKWAGNEVRRRVAKRVKITGKVIKGRMMIDISGSWGRVWVGLNPVNLRRLNPRQTSTGVTAGPAKRPGAFISKKLYGNVFEREGKSRLPIRKSAGLDISDGTAELAGVSAEIGDRLIKEFERELKWKMR